MNIEQYTSVAFGAFTGVIAGLIVSIITGIALNKIKLKQQIKCAKFEIKYTISKYETWISHLKELKEHIATETSEQFARYIDLSRAPAPTFNTLHSNGDLYKYIDFDTIKSLTEVGNKLTRDYEIFFNQKIQEIKENEDKNCTDIVFT